MQAVLTDSYARGYVLAPMAGYTDSAFRSICRRQGATCVVTEMTAAAGLSRGSGKTEQETIEQIEKTVVLTRDGVPVRIRDVAQVQTGPAFRRGALDFNGHEAVGGVVVMRYGENPRDVIERVKAKVDSLESELEGIKIHGVYDRTLLIDETIATLTDVLAHEIIVTIVVMVLFLLHVRASIVIAITLPFPLIVLLA